MPVVLDLSTPPARAFWCDRLCFEAYDDLLAACEHETAARREVRRRAGSETLARLALEVAERAGGSVGAFTNVALALAFLEGRRTAAIVDAAAAFLSPAALDAFRMPSGSVRRLTLALYLLERAPDALVAVELWDQWHTRRGAWYRLADDTPVGINVRHAPWSEVVASVLADITPRDARFAPFEAPVVFLGAEDDVLIGLREWPVREAVRVGEAVVTGERPSWTLLRIYDHGRRVDITDRSPDRGAELAGHLVRRLDPAAGEFEQVLNELTDEVLDGFLRRVTHEDPAFPLLEITAELPWDARHREVVLRGRPDASAAWLVEDQRRRGPFAEQWRTVKTVKLLFEGTHRIEVHFPVPGRPPALAFSDIDRDKRITRRFAAMLNRELKREVAPKARVGARAPRSRTERPPVPRSSGWWGRLLAPKHDRPPVWVDQGLRYLAGEGLLALFEVGVIRCGDPHLQCADLGDRWAECNGDIEVNPPSLDEDEPHRLEDDGAYECPSCGFRWRPVRRVVPVDLRVKVELVHARAWEMLVAEVEHYGPVEEEPGRPGVVSVRLAGARVFVAYEPMLTSQSLPGLGDRIARVAAPFGGEPPEGGVRLAQVLAGDDVLAPAWGLAASRHRERYCGRILPASANESTARVIELLGLRRVRVSGRIPQKHGGYVVRLARLLALADFHVGARSAHDAKTLLRFGRQAGILSSTDTDHHLHILVQRGRDGVDDATGVKGRGAEAFVTDGGYRLGDGWEVRQLEVRAG